MSMVDFLFVWQSAGSSGSSRQRLNHLLARYARCHRNPSQKGFIPRTHGKVTVSEDLGPSRTAKEEDGREGASPVRSEHLEPKIVIQRFAAWVPTEWDQATAGCDHREKCAKINTGNWGPKIGEAAVRSQDARESHTSWKVQRNPVVAGFELATGLWGLDLAALENEDFIRKRVEWSEKAITDAAIAAGVNL